MHFCTYGFTSLYYDEEALGKAFSGYGFELTFRLKSNGEQRDALIWVCNLLQNLGRYVFGSGNGFKANQWIPANGPINVGYPTDIVALAFVADPQLPATDSPHGRVEFLPRVGLTSSEMDDIKAKRRTCEEVVNALRQNNPLLITDLDRRD